MCVKTFQVTIKAKKFFCKSAPNFLHVVFNVIEKHGLVFLPLVFALFSRCIHVMYAKNLISTGGVLRCLHGGKPAFSCKDIINWVIPVQSPPFQICSSFAQVIGIGPQVHSECAQQTLKSPKKQNTVSSKYSYECSNAVYISNPN